MTELLATTWSEVEHGCNRAPTLDLAPRLTLHLNELDETMTIGVWRLKARWT